eukprot:5877523-Prymnesium_polylepis.1
MTACTRTLATHGRTSRSAGSGVDQTAVAMRQRLDSDCAAMARACEKAAGERQGGVQSREEDR